VNYVVDGDRIVVRTNPGTKLDAALRNAVVAFEVDHYDPVAHTGWSVLVTGRATVIDDQTDIAAVKRLPLRAWGAVPADRFVAISMDLVNGRRIPAGGPG
jgi:nitroimidazol reductase NimA-like FMN-containing flavoprotein (pyridoxamine 5'-phosphate oxidase superfamily)